MQQSDWSFVAMEYYATILNRTFLISINDESLNGIKCRGLTSVASGADPLTRILTAKLSVSGNLNDPNSFVDGRLLNTHSRANFTIMLSDIQTVEYSSRKKWGMGYYPHDGRVFVATANRKREFIILGHQSGADTCARLRAAIERANNSFKPKPLRGSAYS